MDDAPLQVLAAVEEAYLRQHAGDRRSLARVLRISAGALYCKLSRLRGMS